MFEIDRAIEVLLGNYPENVSICSVVKIAR